MKTFFKIADKLSTLLGAIGGVLTVAILLFLLFNVFERWLINDTVNGAYEITQIMLGLFFFASYSYAQTNRRHVCLSIVINKLPDKGKFVLYTILSIMHTAMSIVLVYAFFLQGNYALKSGYSTANLHIALYPMCYIASIFMAVFALTLITDIFKSIMALAGDEECKADIQSGWV